MSTPYRNEGGWPGNRGGWNRDNRPATTALLHTLKSRAGTWVNTSLLEEAVYGEKNHRTRGRISSLVKRYNQTHPDERIETFKSNNNQRQESAYRFPAPGQEVDPEHLTMRERMLSVLRETPGKWVKMEVLATRLYGDTSTLHINCLRNVVKRYNDSGARPRVQRLLVRGIYVVGYRINLPGTNANVVRRRVEEPGVQGSSDGAGQQSQEPEKIREVAS